VVDYSDILIEQIKKLIILETKEKYEDCARIKKYLDGLSEALAQTINDLAGVPIDNTIDAMKHTSKTIYDKLKASM
jgi:hypothetical protein